MRKIIYNEGVGQEKFIVPLLKENILRLLKSIDAAMNKLVLDIGCGNQPFKKTLTQEGWQYKSLDVVQNDYNNVDYISKIDSDIDINEKFDLLFCTEVLEHVLYWEKAFSNFKELANENGYVLLTTPFFYPPHEEPFDYWRPTHFTIESFSKKYGFCVIDSIKAGTVWDVLGTIMYATYLKPKNSSFKTKLLYLLLYHSQNWLKKQLSKKRIQNNIQSDSKLYMSNIFLLQKC